MRCILNLPVASEYLEKFRNVFVGLLSIARVFHLVARKFSRLVSTSFSSSIHGGPVRAAGGARCLLFDVHLLIYCVCVIISEAHSPVSFKELLALKMIYVHRHKSHPDMCMFLHLQSRRLA